MDFSQLKAQAQIMSAEARKMEAQTKLGTGIASGRKDIATIEKLEAEADGQEIDNIAKLREMVMLQAEQTAALQDRLEQAITVFNIGPGGPNGGLQ